MYLDNSKYVTPEVIYDWFLIYSRETHQPKPERSSIMQRGEPTSLCVFSMCELMPGMQALCNLKPATQRGTSNTFSSTYGLQWSTSCCRAPWRYCLKRTSQNISNLCLSQNSDFFLRSTKKFILSRNINSLFISMNSMKIGAPSEWIYCIFNNFF